MKRPPATDVTRCEVSETEWVERALTDAVMQCLGAGRCAIVVGPHEVGKSKLAREIQARFDADGLFLDGSDPEHQMLLQNGSGLAWDIEDRLIIIDEIQEFPNSFNLIRAELESAQAGRRSPPRFLLLCSAPLASMAAHRLGTRARIFNLTPITVVERQGRQAGDLGEARLPTDVERTSAISLANRVIPLDALWLRGGFPESLLADGDDASFDWRARYIDMLCARDYRHVNPKYSGATIREILGRIAATQGESSDKIRREQQAILDYFEDLGLVRQLRPWYPNELKRFEKNPKIYIRDSGLLHCLLGRRTLAEVHSDSTVLGHSWEGFCIENIILAAPTARPYFYRSDDQEEIDLILEFPGQRRMPIEIKAGKAGVSKGTRVALNTIEPAFPLYVVRPVPEGFQERDCRVVTLDDMVDEVRRIERL